MTRRVSSFCPREQAFAPKSEQGYSGTWRNRFTSGFFHCHSVNCGHTLAEVALLTSVVSRRQRSGQYALDVSPQMATLSLHLAAAAQGIDDALIQPYSGHESRQSLEIYSRLSLSLAEAGLRTNDAHLSCGVNLQRRHLGGFSPLHGWGKEGRRTFS